MLLSPQIFPFVVEKAKEVGIASRQLGIPRKNLQRWSKQTEYRIAFLKDRNSNFTVTYDTTTERNINGTSGENTRHDHEEADITNSIVNRRSKRRSLQSVLSFRLTLTSFFYSSTTSMIYHRLISYWQVLTKINIIDLSSSFGNYCFYF